MKVGGAWLEAAGTQAVLGMLTQAGHHALVVGGCVRNALLGVPVSDVDIATDARPETVSALAEKAGLRAVPTGIAHGTVTVVAGGEGFEVTTFRHDEETFGRHARVSFGASLQQDAARRDFTMNALYAEWLRWAFLIVGGAVTLVCGWIAVRSVRRLNKRIAEFEAELGERDGAPMNPYAALADLYSEADREKTSAAKRGRAGS